MALGYIRHENSKVFLTLQGRMALRKFDEDHKNKSNKESANVFSIIISVLAILVSMLNTVAGLVKTDATVNYASINLFTYMLSVLEALLIGLFVAEFLLPSVKNFRFHPVARFLSGAMVPSRFFRKLIEAASAPPCSSPPPSCSARPSPPASTCPGTSSCPIRAPRCTSASPSPASGPSCRPGRSLRLSSSA